MLDFGQMAGVVEHIRRLASLGQGVGVRRDVGAGHRRGTVGLVLGLKLTEDGTVATVAPLLVHAGILARRTSPSSCVSRGTLP